MTDVFFPYDLVYFEFRYCIVTLSLADTRKDRCVVYLKRSEADKLLTEGPLVKQN